MKTIIIVAVLVSMFSSQNLYGQELCQRDEINSFVSRFEEFQRIRYSRGVLEFFVPPENDDEKKTLSFLLALDIFSDGSSPRLYNTAGTYFKLDSWKIEKIEYQDAHGFAFCKVHLEEVRQYQNQATGSIESSREKKYLMIFRAGDEWKIGEYLSEPYGIGKYSGWIK